MSIIDVTALSDFFNVGFTETYTKLPIFDTGHQTSQLDILFQKARRAKVISENKLFDFIQTENDPNYNRGFNSSKIEKLVSKLSITTQMVGMVNAQLIASGIHEYIPTNLKTLLFNFQSIADTNINFISNINRGITFQQIENAILSDLKIQYNGGDITYKEIANIANSIFDVMVQQDSIENNSIKTLLSLQLQSILPDSMTGIFNDLSYLSTLEEIFTGDNLTNFIDGMKNKINSYGKTKISSIIVNDYDNLYITFDDILGLNTRTTFTNDIITGYSTALEEFVDEVIINQELNNISSTNITAIKNGLTSNAVSNVNAGIQKSTIALPPLSRVVKATNTETYNKTIQAVTNAYEKFSRELLIDNNINLPTGTTKAIDHLLNVKRNIELRLEYTRHGNTTKTKEIDKYLKSVLILPNNIDIINSTYLAEINKNLNTVLKINE